MFIYEIYIKSFNKSNDLNQFGDLQGVIEKADYLNDLGVDAIWITPFYPSPLIDNGYDVADYLQVDQRLGTIEDFKALIATYHRLNIKVYIDVVFNHSSDQHQWFKQALAGDKHYQDYYMFEDKPVNNWQSMFKGSAWTYVPEIDKYYLHRFAKQQPDLNYMNDKVINEVKQILKYWTELGVDGFRFDVINFLITDKDRYAQNSIGTERPDLNMPGTYEVIKELKQYTKSINPNVTFIGEIGSDEIDILQTYVGEDLMDFVFTFNVSSLERLDVIKLGQELEKTYAVIENPTIFFSSHDMSRFFRRLANYDSEIHLMLVKLMFTLKGTKILFQGDENQTKDFECTSIDNMSDIQSVNEYHQLVSEGMPTEVAFEQSMKNNRDFSRNFIDFNQNSEQLASVKAIINNYHTSFFNKADICDIVYSKHLISFTRVLANKTVKFEFNFENKTIKEDYEQNL